MKNSSLNSRLHAICIKSRLHPPTSGGRRNVDQNETGKIPVITADNFREKSKAEKPAVQSPERKRGRRSQKPDDHRRRRCDAGVKSRTTTGEEGATPETKPVDGYQSRIESPNDGLRIAGRKPAMKQTSVSL
ncbi:hypothetical protein F2Q68_00007939 [Brassica cretica]|uniref:Uncharacterized protein n=1 Tax=Brassica cretica TaxID=69181 RepID=A0A8S9L5P3_BRACR|nr:hypothetical protein F2Q68_00007939 [Brassica cretica]